MFFINWLFGFGQPVVIDGQRRRVHLPLSYMGMSPKQINDRLKKLKSTNAARRK